MGGFNPHSPTLLGSEHQATRDPTVKLDSALAGLAMRFQADGTPTIANLHPYLQQVAGNPGLALELVDELLPAITDTDFFPGTDTGATETGWKDQGGGSTEFSEIDDRYDTSEYHTNTAALSRQATLVSDHRGNNAGGLAGQRVLTVTVGANVQLRRGVAQNDLSVNVRARLTINGQTYRSAPVEVQQTATAQELAVIGTWARNPATGLPWTEAEVDDLLDPADADTFGVEVSGRLGVEGFRLHGRWLTARHCDENRVGFYYQGGAPRAGWTERALSGTAALVDGESYWYVVYPLTGAAGDYLRIPRLRDPEAAIDDLGFGGEHRTAYELRLSSVGGVAVTATEVEGGLLPVLFDSGSIEAWSQPYAELDPIEVNRDNTSGDQIAQQITAPSGTEYVAILATVGWMRDRWRPRRPLQFKVWTGGIGGTLRATATLHPGATTARARRYLIPLDAPFTSTAAQHTVEVVSETIYRYTWRLWRLDTRTDHIGSGTTSADLQGATQGGTTDSWTVDGTPDDRYDLPIALVAAPPGPEGFTATVLEAR